MYKRYGFLILIAVYFFIPGCSEYPPEPEPTVPNHILPLVVGNTWMYNESVFDTSGVLISENDTVVHSVLEQLKGDNLGYFAVQIIKQSSSNPIVNYLSNKPDGLWELTGSALPFTYNLLFKYPANVGDSYFRNDYIITVLATDTLIHTFDTSYFCYHYHFEPTGQSYLSNSDIFYSPRIGYIKGIGRSFVDSQLVLTSIIELVSYQLLN